MLVDCSLEEVDNFPRSLSRVLCTSPSVPRAFQYYPQSTAPDMVKMAEKEIPGVVMDHKREWRQQKRDLDEGTKRGVQYVLRSAILMHQQHVKAGIPGGVGDLLLLYAVMRVVIAVPMKAHTWPHEDLLPTARPFSICPQR